MTPIGCQSTLYTFANPKYKYLCVVSQIPHLFNSLVSKSVPNESKCCPNVIQKIPNDIQMFPNDLLICPNVVVSSIQPFSMSVAKNVQTLNVQSFQHLGVGMADRLWTASAGV